MVKTKKKRSTSRANNGGMSRPSRGVRGGGLMLDKAAMDHIRLMADPCQGRLVPAAYPTPGGGAIQRFRAVVSVGVGGGGAGFTAGAFSWKPTSNEYVILNAANGSTPAQPVTASVFPGLTTPGTATSTLTFRCTAACVRAITNASEMNRSGLVYAGQTFQNYLVENGTNTTTVDTVASSLPVSARMPARNIEVLWVPTELDQTFNADSTTEILSSGQGATNSAITVAFVGAPGSLGMTFELTAVYEINYNANGNVVAFPSPVSATPWTQVLKAFYTTIRDSPVIIDTVRAGVDYLGLSASSQPGRLVAGVARRALTY